MALGPMLTSLLARYGLASLTRWAEQAIIDGKSPEELELELYDRPEFQAAYPEIELRRKQAQATGISVEPISADQILAYRAQARAMMRSRGLPSSFYSQDADFRDLIVNDVSLDELNGRLQLSVDRVRQAPPQVRSMFDEITGGLGDNALFSLFFDPTKSMDYLEDLVQEAEAGGAARRFGFNLSAIQRNRIADLNIDYSQATEGFAALDAQRGLFEESLYEEVDFTAEEEGTEAVFGLEGGAEERLRRRAETRTAQTAGGAGGLAEDRGSTGLGGAGRR